MPIGVPTERAAEYAIADASLSHEDVELASILHDVVHRDTQFHRGYPAPIFRLMASRMREPDTRERVLAALSREVL